jgi:tetratricopeptide (TPR) repeat protein
LPDGQGTDARERRERRVAEAERVVGLLRQARAAVEQAEIAVTTGLADDVLLLQVTEARHGVDADLAEAQQRLGQATKDATFLAALEKAYEVRFMGTGRGPGYPESSRACAEAFRAYGRDVTQGPEGEAAAWVKALPDDVREDALVALYVWWRFAPQRGLKARLWRLVEEADDDPWRRDFQAAASRKEPRLVDQLTQKARERPLPAASCVLLADLLVSGGRREEALALLRGARLLYPRDFSLHDRIGMVLHLSGGRRPSEAVLEEQAGCFRTGLAIRPDSIAALNNLGLTLVDQGKLDDAVAVLRRAVDLYPKDSNFHYNVGVALAAQNNLDEAIAEFRRALALDSKDARARNNLCTAYNNRGNALATRNDLDKAIADYRQALDIDPDFAVAYYNLGNALNKQNKPVEAAKAFKKAVKIQPDFFNAQLNLGVALGPQNKLDEAEVALRKAVSLQPGNALARYNLGLALAGQKKLDEAIAEYREAIKIDPTSAPAYHNLGNALNKQNKASEAIEAYKKAVSIQPDFFNAQLNLGVALGLQNKLEEAEAALRKAVSLQPRNALARYNLGNALAAQGKWDEAADACRKALDIDPRRAQTHGALGDCLLRLGRFAEARDSLLRCLDLLESAHPLRRGVSQQLQECDRLLALEVKLPAVLAGQQKPADAAEAVGLAEVCRLTRRPADAARLLADVLADHPDWARDPRAALRYNAACAAVLAASGQGQDALAEGPARAKLRGQALAWLRADLDAWAKLAADGNAAERKGVQAAMRHWQGNTDLVAVRHPLLLLLPTEERRDWLKLWDDVEALRARAEAHR